MERLTSHELDNWNEPGCQDCSAYCYECCKAEGAVEGCIKRQMYNRLAYYEDLEEQGRLITLPFSGGAPLYKLATENLKPTGEIVELKIKGVSLSIATEPYNIIEYNELGKTAFLNFKEAKEAVRNLKTK